MSAELFRGKWRYRKVVKLPDGTKVRISGKGNTNTKGAAQAEELNHINRILNPQLVQAVKLKKDIVTFADWAPKYLELSAINDKHGTQFIKSESLRKHLTPYFGAMNLDSIDYSNVQDFIATKTAKYSRHTINKWLGVLGHIFNMAKKRKLIAEVPETKKLKIEDEDFDYLTFDEADKVINAATGMWKVMIFMAIRTGMRPGELLAVRWKDIDLLAKRVVVKQTYALGVFNSPKNNKQREIPLASDILAALKKYQAQNPGKEYLFTRSNGAMIKERTRPLRAVLKAAGIRETIDWRHLRHTFASHLVMNGVAIYTVQSLMGHSTPKMTMRYAHLAPIIKVDAVETLVGNGIPVQP